MRKPPTLFVAAILIGVGVWIAVTRRTHPDKREKRRRHERDCKT